MSSEITNSATPGLDGDQVVAVLKRLPGILAREGYVDAYTLYGPLNARLELWARDLHLLPDKLRTFFKLFLLGQTVRRDDLLESFTPFELDALEQLSILIRAEHGFHSGNLVIVPAFGYFLVAQRPTINPYIYFGEDSAALAQHLSPPHNGDCLDLCAGPGIQSLVCSGRARKVVAVEINPLAASYAELNVVMNNLEHVIEVRNGDLYQAVMHDDFDFICANPPLLPFVPDLPYPFVGHGGPDGLSITRKILQGLTTKLRPGGVCQIIGSCLGNEVGPLCEKELHDFALENNLRVNMTVPSALPLTPGSSMFKSLAWSCAGAAGLDFEMVLNRFEIHLKQLEATRLNSFFLFISKTDARPGFSITRHYREQQGFWFLKT